MAAEASKETDVFHNYLQCLNVVSWLTDFFVLDLSLSW